MYVLMTYLVDTIVTLTPSSATSFGDVAEGWQFGELLHASRLLQSETCNSGWFLRHYSFQSTQQVIKLHLVR